MKCKLCGEHRVLIKSHVIPKSFYRLNPYDRQPTRLLTNIPGRHSQKVPIGVYDPRLVCEECERLFSPWDDYAADVLLKKGDQFETVSKENEVIAYKLPAFDYLLLKLFFLSLLWRAAASTQPMFSKVDLGSREKILKEALREGDPGTEDFFGVILRRFDTTELGILDPHLERFSGVRFCLIYLGHIVAYIKVDARPFPERMSAVALTPGAPLLLMAANFLTSPERRVMKNLVLAEHSKSKKHG